MLFCVIHCSLSHRLSTKHWLFVAEQDVASKVRKEEYLHSNCTWTQWPLERQKRMVPVHSCKRYNLLTGLAVVQLFRACFSMISDIVVLRTAHLRGVSGDSFSSPFAPVAEAGGGECIPKLTPSAPCPGAQLVETSLTSTRALCAAHLGPERVNIFRLAMWCWQE